MKDRIPVTECVLATEDAHLPPVVPGLYHHVHIVLNVGALRVALDNEMIDHSYSDMFGIHLQDTSLKISSQKLGIRQWLIRVREMFLHNVPTSPSVVEVGDDSLHL